jgi:7-cyano-7-deazaguanine synthase
MNKPQTVFNVAQAYGTPAIIGCLLSGGVDSTTSLHIAVDSLGSNFDEKLIALSIDYGQRHAKEIECAANIADALNLQHEILSLPGIPTTMLTDASQEVPNAAYGDLVGVSPTYVPFRNGLMLATATAWLIGELDRRIKEEGIDPSSCAHLYIGTHAEDAAAFAYPDCTPEFIGSMTNAIYTGTYGRVRLIAPLLYSMKRDIVKRGDELGVDFSDTWSCYKGEEIHCGTCPTCRARKAAFADAEVSDPTDYAA